MIDEKYVLTAAHTFTNFFNNKKFNPSTQPTGYVKQALHQGKTIGKYRIKFESVKLKHIPTHNEGWRTKDFALFEVEPEG